jgi:hypothetical protein
MCDIIDRLHHVAYHRTNVLADVKKLAEDAANEIKKSRARIKQLEKVIRHLYPIRKSPKILCQRLLFGLFLISILVLIIIVSKCGR